MGKGYNNYMCKKPFHPGSKANIKRAWMAEQKTENEKRKQEELKTQYEKEQDLYNNRALISSESKDKLELNFMYEAPPGAKRERQKEDDEPEYKFEWQRKYNAPREDYARGNEDIKDQPFGIPVRNVRCIKCHKWGHINTDRECPLFMQASASSMPSTSMDPIELMRQMREDGYGLKENVLGHHMNTKAANQQLIPSDESDPETEFLKSLSTAEKKKLLRKLKKLSKKQAKKEKKKSKKSKKSKSKESSESESDVESKRKKKKTKKEKWSSSSSDSSSEESDREQNHKKNKKKSSLSTSKEEEKYILKDKLRKDNKKYVSDTSNKHHRDKESKESDRKHASTSDKSKRDSTYENTKKSKDHKSVSVSDVSKNHKKVPEDKQVPGPSNDSENAKHSSSSNKESLKSDNKKAANWISSYSSSSSESEDIVKKKRASSVEGKSGKRKICTGTSEIEGVKKVKVEKTDSDNDAQKVTSNKPEHPDGFSHLCPQTKIESNYTLASEEYKGKMDDKFRHFYRVDRSPSVKQKYNK